MLALITGASSGIGRDMARSLSRKGYELILVARREDRLAELQNELPGKAEIVSADLSDTHSCHALYERVKDRKIDFLINNAGFGQFGAFDETDLDTELRMIDTNIRAVHILTKLFLRDFIARDSGMILNVASSAAFMPGPLMSTYYATKAYVLRLTEAIHEELRRRGSKVYIGAFCPGPIETEFNQTADVQFSLKGLSSEYAAKYALDKALRKKMVIVPGVSMKLAKFGVRLAPDGIVLRVCYHFQHRKKDRS